MSDRERYLSHAAEAERMAKAMPEGPERDELLKIAAEWRKLEALAAAPRDRTSEPESS